MDEKELIKGLEDVGCSRDQAARICSLYKAGSYREILHQLKMQRCALMDAMHESQRKVDRMDFLIRKQEEMFS